MKKNLNFDLANFSKNGVCMPFKIKNNLLDFQKEYFDFQKKSKMKLGHPISLKPNLLSTFFDRLCFDENVLSIVKKIIGENIYIWSSAIFEKAPNDGKFVSYHQDKPYWQLSSNSVVTAWIALTKSNKKSGALEIVPGSHRKGLIKKLDVENARKSYLKNEKTTPAEDLLSFNQNLKKYISKNKPVPIELEPGEFSVHHVNTVHGSKKNKSKNYRIGFAIRYISSETRHLVEKSGDSALHVCGKKNQYFRNEKRPVKSFSKSTIEQYNKAMNSAGSFGNKKYID